MDNLIFTSESVILYERKRIHALKYEEIICIKTDRPYLVITTVESLQMFIQMSLSKVGELLPDYFCLCNQSTIINLTYAYLYEEHNGHFFVSLSAMLEPFEVSRRCKRNIKNKMLYINKNRGL